MRKTILSLALIFYCMSIITAQDLETNEEFIFVVFELEETQSELIEAKLITQNVIKKSLKTPTISQDVTQSDNYVCVQLLSESGKVLDCVNYEDPLTEHLEYVNEEGQLGHTHLKKAKNAFVLRRPISKETRKLQILQFKNDKFRLLNSANLNQK